MQHVSGKRKSTIQHENNYNFFFPFFSLTVHLAIGQTDSLEIPISNEVRPKFRNGENDLFKILSDSLVYPKNAKHDRIGGKVLVQFTVDTLGNATNVKVAQGIREDLDQEAIRVIKLLNGWSPALKNGKKVSVDFNFPIYFFPDDKFEKNYRKEHK